MAEDLNRERLTILGELARITQEINRYNAEGVQNAQRENELNRERIRIGRQLQRVNENIRKSQRQSYVDSQNDIKSLTSMYNPLKKADLERIQLMLKAGNLSDVAVKRGNELADINRKISQLTSDQTLERDILQEQFDAEIVRFSRQVGISQEIVDNLRNQNQLARDYSSMTEGQKEQLEAQLEVYNGIKKTLGGILDTASLLTSGRTGFLGMSLIGLGKFADKLGEVRSQLGGIAEMGTTAISFFDDNAVENAKELSNQFGGIKNVSAELQLSTSLISKNMGISGTDAASLLGSFSRLNGNSEETALNLVKSSQEFAKQNGIIPAQLMADVAGSAEEFALYGKNGGKNLIQAAVAARKMGVELKTMTGITDNLLDFESSITKELELGAMLGKNINLDRARGLAYAGKTTEAVDETLRALGGVAAFNNMDVFQKRATADLLGIQVAELDRMVNKQKEAATVSGEIGAKFNLLSEGTSYIANEWGGGILKGMGGALIAAGQLNMGFGAMGTSIGGVVKGTTQILGNLLKMIAGPVLSGLKTVGTSLSGSSVGKRVGSFKNKLLEGVGNTTQKSTNKTSGAGNMLKGLSSGIKSLASIPVVAIGKLALIMGTLTLAIIGIGYALKLAAPGIEAFGTAISNIVSAVGGVIIGLVGALGDMFTKISSVASPELALSIIGLAGGFAALTASLSAFSIVGLAAVPAMAAVGAFATLASGVDSLFGNDTTQPTNENDTMKMLLDEIRGLRTDLNNGKVAVYMDGAKVTASVSKVVNRQATNQYM